MKTALTTIALTLSLALTGCGASVGAYTPALAQQAIAGGGANAKAVASKADTEWATGHGKLTLKSLTSQEVPGEAKTKRLTATGTTADGALEIEATVVKEGVYDTRPTRITFNGAPLTRGRATALGQVLMAADATAVGAVKPGDRPAALLELDSALLYNRIDSGAFTGLSVGHVSRTVHGNGQSRDWWEQFTVTGKTAKGPFTLVLRASNILPNGGMSYVSMAFVATFNGRAIKGDQAAEIGELLGNVSGLGQEQDWMVSEASHTLWFNRLGR
jgi:hypothetical protein